MSDLVLGLDRIALITGNNLVELVTILRNTGLGRRLAIVGGGGSSGSGGYPRDMDADVVVCPDIGTL